MSKNVAVFVDVANIFYAAKAAGVDIDYVTLLKSATAGRDFVRAYAYTGLDPENENQRQFHAFLARSGYKVISKDIRKYGDGRIKANLDIELVVDMMRMAQHIDIAVVVSGDGDFAPAIRAVQQLGVRCEVISFRGNTSSDLIDVADVFTDITQIARVEKGARSGRRVAAEGDLSMTAVPEKETEGLARRRRSRRDEPEERVERVDRVERVERPERLERPERPAAEALPGNLIVLPGERLSRAGGPEDAEFDGDIDEAAPDAAQAASIEPAADGQLDGTEADRQRRRRRRGGRGRGRGRQQYDTPLSAEGGVEIVSEDEEFLEDEIAPLPQHSTFGSVWDNQLGVTPPPITSSGGDAGVVDEEYEDEPEIPEYLLAERRQRGRGGRPGGMRQAGGNRRGGYQSAVDRERYGRSGTSSFSGAGGNRIDRPRPQGGNRGPQQSRPQQPRPQRPTYQEPMREQERPVTASAEPWSEVPPEVQELLRAELARRQSQSAARSNEGYGRQESPAAETRTAEPAAASAVAEVEPAPARGRRTRSTTRATSATEAATAEPVTETPSGDTATAAPARRGRRTSTASTTATVPTTDVAVTEAPAAPKPRGRRSSAASSSSATEAPISTAESAPAEAAEAAAPRKRTTRSKAAAEPSADSSTASTPDSASGGTAATPRRRTTRRTASAADTEG